MWYHDHLFDFTAPNVVRGLAGFYLVFDEIDSGDENDEYPALGLPSGDFDIPLVIQDRRIGYDGQLLYDPLDHDGFLGDTYLVNGAVQPYVEVQRRRYRFRFLNGSNARFYRIVLASADGAATVPVAQIATEGGLLAAPIRSLRSFQFAPAERVEVVVDFSVFPAGTALYFENRLQQDDGRKPGDVLSRGARLLEVRVKGPAVHDPSRVPDVLRPFAPVTPEELNRAVHRHFKFERTHGSWAINGELADLEHPLTESTLNGGEIWHLESSGGWAHPVHIHLEFMRVLRRNGALPRLNERDGMAKKDTIVIGDDFGDVDVYLKFRDYAGPFVFHCHNIEHEDMRMMARMDVNE
jgi:FtsP/CotA-like multicopper oxidase with cupredoxin domain